MLAEVGDIVQQLEVVRGLLPGVQRDSLTQSEMSRIVELASDIITSARTVSNSLSPINRRLDPEALYAIFDWVVLETMNSGETYKFIVLTHVCHYWRELMLAAPMLWRFVDFSNMRLAELALQRSGSTMPLSVKMLLDDPYDSEGSIDEAVDDDAELQFEIVRAQSHRIASLHITDNSDSVIDIISLLSEICLPKIHTLYLRAFCAQSCLPPLKFNGGVPSLLRRATLIDYGSCDTISSSLLNVVHLSIQFQPQPHMSEFLDMLVSLPELVHLTLWGTTPLYDKTTEDLVVYPKKLKKLEIHGLSSKPVHHIALPKDGLLSVSNSRSSPLLPQDVSHFPNLMCIEVLHIKFRRGYYSVTGTTLGNPRWTNLVMNISSARMGGVLLFTEIAKIPKERVKVLCIEGFDPQSSNSCATMSKWRDCLMSFGNLKKLVLADACRNVQEALGDASIPCRDLVDLEVFESSGRRASWRSVEEMLRKRVERGRRIDHLKVMYTVNSMPSPDVGFEAGSVEMILEKQKPEFRVFERVYY